eukprot:gene15137-biopygen7502
MDPDDTRPEGTRHEALTLGMEKRQGHPKLGQRRNRDGEASKEGREDVGKRWEDVGGCRKTLGRNWGNVGMDRPWNSGWPVQ